MKPPTRHLCFSQASSKRWWNPSLATWCWTGHPRPKGGCGCATCAKGRRKTRRWRRSCDLEDLGRWQFCWALPELRLKDGTSTILWVERSNICMYLHIYIYIYIYIIYIYIYVYMWGYIYGNYETYRKIYMENHMPQIDGNLMEQQNEQFFRRWDPDGLFEWYPMDVLGASPQTSQFLLVSPELSKSRHANSQKRLRGCSFGANRPLFSVVFPLTVPSNPTLGSEYGSKPICTYFGGTNIPYMVFDEPKNHPGNPKKSSDLVHVPCWHVVALMRGSPCRATMCSRRSMRRCQGIYQQAMEEIGIDGQVTNGSY